MSSLFEIRWEKLAAVLLASLSVNEGRDITWVLRRVAEGDRGWVGYSALILLVDLGKRESVLEDLRRGLKPSSKLVDEATTVIKSVLSRNSA